LNQGATFAFSLPKVAVTAPERATAEVD
jgi:hypothetical protein